MEKIVLVGGSSALAKYLVQSLSENYALVTLDRQDCDIYCDLLEDSHPLVLPENTDIVIHLAASFNSHTDEEILTTERTNALGTLRVCMAAHEAGIKHLIVISSIYATLAEDSIYYSIYSLSKKHSEDLALFYCGNRQLPLTILRPSQIYDAKGDFRRHQPLLYLMADRAEQGRDITIYGSHDALRNYLHVEDLVEIIVRTVRKRITGLYSCVNTQDVRLSDIARGALSAFGQGGNVVFLNDKADIPDNVFAKDMTLCEKIDYYPQIDMTEGMRKICQYRAGERR